MPDYRQNHPFKKYQPIRRYFWDFGKTQFNILMIVVGYGDFQIPLYWKLLDNNSGNSCTQDRKDLLELIIRLLTINEQLCIKTVGKERIGYIVGNREFIGHSWIKYLKERGILFVMRLPKHHLVTRSDGSASKIEQLGLNLNKALILKNCLVDGVVAHAWIKRLETCVFFIFVGNGEYGRNRDLKQISVVI